jgi:hypothetical protein
VEHLAIGQSCGVDPSGCLCELLVRGQGRKTRVDPADRVDVTRIQPAVRTRSILRSAHTAAARAPAGALGIPHWLRDSRGELIVNCAGVTVGCDNVLDIRLRHVVLFHHQPPFMDPPRLRPVKTNRRLSVAARRSHPLQGWTPSA